MKFTSLFLRGSEARSQEVPAPIVNQNAPLWTLFSGMDTWSQEVVTTQTALRVSSVYAAIRVLSESISSLPLRLYRPDGNNLVEATEDPLHYLLSVEPNPEMSAVTLFETATVSLMLHGNAYIEIERNSAGLPIGLWPLSPKLTEPLRLPNGQLSYRTSDGEKPGATRTIPADRMIHALLMSLDGLVGLSPIQQAASAIGLAQAANRYSSRFLANDATPTLALKVAEQVSPEDKQRMRSDWETLQGGANRHRLAILDQGLDVKQLSISPQDAMLLETLKWSREEVAAVYRVPPFMIGEPSKISNANLVQQNLDFVVNGIRPLLTKFEAEIQRKLLPKAHGTNGAYRARFDVSERLRGDFASSAAAYAAGRQWGWFSANDVRRDMGLNPGGPELDRYVVPANLQDATAVPQGTPAPATPQR